MMKEMWGQRYAETEYIFGTNPNEFFKQELDKLEPGKILRPAEGGTATMLFGWPQGRIHAFFTRGIERRFFN